ncbi:MAG: hypothetical protein JNG85_01350 [Spirochaetaceae bacterium]|nr:hypothetical protein [Spirochaetaceae bacterium]
MWAPPESAGGAAGAAASPAGAGAAGGAGGSVATAGEGGLDAAGLAALKAAVVEALGKNSPLLKSGLGASLPWRVEGERLVIPFRSGMEEGLVRGELPALSRAAAEASGRHLKVELRVESPAKPRAAEGGAAGIPENDPAAIVERVFRGTRVKES